MRITSFSLIGAFLLFICCLSHSTAQEGEFHLKAGPSIPVGDFGEDGYSEDGVGGAGLGLTAGLEYVQPLNENGLGWFGALDFHYNGFEKDARDDFEELLEFQLKPGIDTDIDYPSFFNFPLSAGLFYQAEINENIRFLLKGGSVLNFLKMSSLEIDIRDLSNGQEATIE